MHLAEHKLLVMERNEEMNLVKLEVNYITFGEKKYLSKSGEEIVGKVATINVKNSVEYTTELGEIVQRDKFSFFVPDSLRYVHQKGGTAFLENMAGDERMLKKLLERATYMIDLQVGKWPLKDVVFNDNILVLFKKAEENSDKEFEALANGPLTR